MAYKWKYLGMLISLNLEKQWYKIKDLVENQKGKKKLRQNKTTKENKSGFLKHMDCIKELDMHLF